MKTDPLRHELLSARNLIREKHYDEARAILGRLQHPLAQKWLAKLNEIAPPAIKPMMPWLKMSFWAVRHPTRKRFEAIAADPRASAFRASWWIFLSAVGGTVLATLASLLLRGTWVAILQGDLSALAEGLFGTLFNGIAGLALFWIGIVIIQTAGRLLGGKGTYSKLAYTVATFASLAQLILPLLLIPIAFLLLFLVYVIPFPIIVMLMGAGILYGVFLNIVAVAAVNRFGWVKATAATLTPLLLIAALNVATIRFFVDGSSMQPTLFQGDYILVSRLNYILGEPARDDLLVFSGPGSTEDDPPQIKRVIGLPGETVELRDSRFYVNGVELTEVYLTEPCNPIRCRNQSWTLDADRYFVVGDNRNNSWDSRIFGPIRRDQLIGEAVFIYWPPSEWRLLP